MSELVTVKKSEIEVYRLKGKFKWADISVDDQGNRGRLQIASDYGDWSYYWGACGTSFKKFLINLQYEYAANKFKADRFFDIDSTIEYLRERVESIGEDHPEYEQCDEEIDSLEDIDDLNEYIQNIQDCKALMRLEDYTPEIMYMIHPGFERFWTELYTVFVDQLKSELDEKQ